MKKPIRHLDRYTDKTTYSYKLSVAPEHGKRTINVVVTAGELLGKSALVIKMPDEFSWFFPALDSNILSDVMTSNLEKNGMTKGSSGRS